MTGEPCPGSPAEGSGLTWGWSLEAGGPGALGAGCHLGQNLLLLPSVRKASRPAHSPAALATASRLVPEANARQDRGRQGMAQAAGAPPPGAGQPCTFKLVLLGSGSVGKSSLALRYVKNDFRSILPTVGCAFFTKRVDLGAASLKFEIWDTAGQEKYHSVCHLYFRGANAALLVYDITSKESFLKAQGWLKDLEREFCPGEVVVALVGNKTDLSEEREVTYEEGKQFAEGQGLLFMETSARANHQVTEVFSAVAWELLRKAEREQHQTPRGDAPLALSPGPSRLAKCCAH